MATGAQLWYRDGRLVVLVTNNPGSGTLSRINEGDVGYKYSAGMEERTREREPREASRVESSRVEASFPRSTGNIRGYRGPSHESVREILVQK